MKKAIIVIAILLVIAYLVKKFVLDKKSDTKVIYTSPPLVKRPTASTTSAATE